jgi:hypothetical protein
MEKVNIDTLDLKSLQQLLSEVKAYKELRNKL